MIRYSKSLEEMMLRHFDSLQEKEQRHYAAIEAKKLGRGGRKYISILFKISEYRIRQGIKELENNNVNALIYDLIPLEYMFNKMEKNSYRLSKKNLFKQNYGFIVPINSPLLRDLNLQILKLKESNEINYIVEDWINRADR